MSGTDKTHGDVTFTDIFHWLRYLEEHYSAETIIQFTTHGTSAQCAMLHIVTTARCRYARHAPIEATFDIPIGYKALPYVPATIYNTMFALCEQIDGGCADCRQMMCIG
jgi:hypothetical protein